MLKYTAKRLLQMIPVLFGITFLSFALMKLAGSDPVLQQMERTGAVLSQELIQEERARLGLDQSFLHQYLSWLTSLLSGDMGTSYVTGKDVLSTFASKLPATALLTAVSLVFTLLLSLPLGILSALYQRGPVDYGIRLFSFLGNSMPGFFTGLVLMYLFSIRLGLLPVISLEPSLKSAVLPALTLAIAMSSKYLRQIRALILEELDKDYVAGARARGIPFCSILFRSILRTSLSSLLTLTTLSVGSLLGGTAIVESIFMWDGVGKLAADSIHMRDYPMIQAYVVWMALIYLCINLATDLSYHFLDPRIRLGGERQ